MTYISGFITPVPTANKAAYIEHAKKAWPMFEKRGAIRMVESWGEDVPKGEQTDFYKAILCQDDETPVMSWIEWPDRATADAAWEDIMSQPEDEMRAQLGDMPFDGKRMFWGGFTPIVDTSA